MIQAFQVPVERLNSGIGHGKDGLITKVSLQDRNSESVQCCTNASALPMHSSVSMCCAVPVCSDAPMSSAVPMCCGAPMSSAVAMYGTTWCTIEVHCAVYPLPVLGY
eukprot:748451-Pelagomonas_calceolata.AAC.2